MRKLAVYFILILLVLVMSGSLVLYGLYESRTARALELFVTFDFKSADSIYQTLEKNFDYGRRMTIFLNKWRNELKISRARVKYWEKNYSELIDSGDYGQDQENEDPNLRFIRANASYKNIEMAKDRKNLAEGIDNALNGYIYTIRKDSENFNAAFNYEYLLRMRNDMLKKPNGKLSDSNQSIHGQKGQPIEGEGNRKIRIHIPLTGEEGKDKLKDDSKDAGKGDFKRKGG